MANLTEPTEFFQRVRHARAFQMPTSHFHDENELYYLESGETRYCIGGEIYFLKPGDMVFVPKGVFHQTSTENETPVERMLLTFDDDFAGEHAAPWLEALRRENFIRLPSDKQSRVSDILRRIEFEEQNRAIGYRDIERACLLELLVVTVRFRLPDWCEPVNESYRIIQSAARYIAANPAADLRLPTLAKRYAMSESYFSRLFKHVTGASLCVYVNAARVAAAEKLLRGQNCTVTQAATESGFNDSNYFATVFKRFKGVAPKQFALSARRNPTERLK